MTPERRADIAASARMGALLLDSRKPGWASVADTATLCMYRSEDCILGQVYGDYPHGKTMAFGGRSYDEKIRLATEHGFFLDHAHDDEAWDQLTACWLAEIAERRPPGVPQP